MVVFKYRPHLFELSSMLPKLDSSKSADDNLFIIKLELSVFVTLSISDALAVPSNKNNIKTTEMHNVAFLIEIFTPSLLSL